MHWQPTPRPDARLVVGALCWLIALVLLAIVLNELGALRWLAQWAEKAI